MTDRDTNDSKSAQQPVMMPAYFPQPSDEIDVVELIIQLWRGKITILGSMVVALLVGAGLSVLNINPPPPTLPSATDYTVGTTFTHMVYPVAAQQHCIGESKCLDFFANQSLSAVIDESWLLLDTNLSLVTDTPLSTAQYEAQLAAIVNGVTEKILADARAEISLITDARAEIIRINLSNPEFRGTQAYAGNWLNATRVITAIESGTRAIAFKPVTISLPKPPKNKLPTIIPISAILGCMLGSVIVLFKNALESRRKESTT